jgi:hypothetical protein
MSPRAITERLRLASHLAALCLALGKARVVKELRPTPNTVRQ